MVNGDLLLSEEVAALERRYRVHVQDGRYWYDRRSGAWGFEGGPPLVNLAELASQAGDSGNNAFYRSGNTDYGAGRSGGTSYVMGEDWSVILDY